MNASFIQEWLETSQRLTQIQARYLKALWDKGKVDQHGLNAVLQDASLSYAQFCLDNIKHPMNLLSIEKRLLGNHLKLCKRSLLKAVGVKQEPVITPQKGDHRFKQEMWDELALFDFIKQSYLLISQAMEEGLGSLEGEDKKTRRRIAFYNRQILNALSPSNFILTNPELLKLTWKSKGKNLINGFERYIQDLEHSASVLNIRMTARNKFELGENIAATPGKVVYRTKLFELIQYSPSTKTVAKEPLLFVPPFVNKYYILDLTSEKSFVKWAIDQGQTIFMVSWVNPDESMQHEGFDDYALEGVIDAASQVARITGEKELNAIGYCIGGTVLATALAYLEERPADFKIKSATFFTTLLDFSDPGDIAVFIDEETVDAIKKQNDKTGFFDGRLLSVSFSLMRENTLYWNYFVQNYLKAEEPPAFDLLYWNSDSTNIAADTHNFMLSELYDKNMLTKPGGIVINEVEIDLSKVTIPCYFLSTHMDHIAYWEATFEGAKLLGGDITFVLGESGHIAGVVNPPHLQKYSYYTNVSQDLKKITPDEWLESAKQTPGSWWPHWSKWMQKQSSKKVPARTVGKGLCSAPGEYVRRQLS